MYMYVKGQPSAAGEVLSESVLSHSHVWRPREPHPSALASQDPGSLCPLPV